MRPDPSRAPVRRAVKAIPLIGIAIAKAMPPHWGAMLQLGWPQVTRFVGSGCSCTPLAGPAQVQLAQAEPLALPGEHRSARCVKCVVRTVQFRTLSGRVCVETWISGCAIRIRSRRNRSLLEPGGGNHVGSTPH